MTFNEAEKREALLVPELKTAEALHAPRVGTLSKNGQVMDDHGIHTHIPTDKGFRVKMREPKYKHDFFHTVSLCLAFMISGAVLGQRGPSILDLQIITQTDVQQSSAFITVLSVGYICGSIMVGFLYDRISKPLLLFINCLTTGLFVAVLPFCSNYILMLVITFVGALPLAGIDVGGNADIIRIWGSEGRSYMQGMHFGFAIGAVIGPLVTEPFLTPRQIKDDPRHIEPVSVELYHNNITTEKLYHCNTTTANTTNRLIINSTIENSTKYIDNETTVVYIAYIIVAAACIITSIPFLMLYCQQPVRELHERKTVKSNHKGNLSSKTFIITLLFINFLNVFYIALEDTMPNFMLLFVVKSMNWTKANGSVITSTYWTAFAISRLLGIFVIRHTTPTKCLLIVYTFLVFSCTGLLFSTVYSFDPGVWVSMVGSGLFMGIIFPTNYTMFSELVTLSGKIVSLISITACVGSIGNPAILGPLMQYYSPKWYVYLILGESVLCLVIFLVLLVYSKTCGESTQTAGKSTQLNIVIDNECQNGNTDVISELIRSKSNTDITQTATHNCSGRLLTSASVVL